MAVITSHESYDLFATNPKLVYYIPGRMNTNGFILINVTQHTNGSWICTPEKEPTHASFGSEHKDILYHHSVLLKDYIHLCDTNGHPCTSVLYVHSGIDVNINGKRIPVISTPFKYSIFFGKNMLKSNIFFKDGIKTVRKQIKPKIPIIAPFIAKNLLDLAILRKEHCPIVALEFVEGSTMVMPCGHLFAKEGLDEVFKVKEDRNICPWCRSIGMPTLV